MKDLIGWTIFGTLSGVVLLVGGNTLAVWRWARRRGLPWEVAVTAASRSTMAAFWKQRTFAELLLPAPAGRARVDEPRTPEDYVRAIVEAAAHLAGPSRDACDEAVAAARQVATDLATLNAELAQLAGDSSQSDLADAERKLAALGDAAADNEARRRMRALLAEQATLLRGLAGQLASATQRRDQLEDLLRTLWLQVASLRAEAAREARDASEVTGRIRAVVAEIVRQREAAAQARALAPGGGA